MKYLASILFLVPQIATATQCSDGRQSLNDICVSNSMIDYVYCVEKAGGNRQSITEIITSANARKNIDQTGGELSGAGKTLAISGAAKLSLSQELSLAEESNAAKVIQTTFFSRGMENCQNFYNQIIDRKARKDASKALKVSEGLRKKSEPRHLSNTQRDSFKSLLVSARKGSVGIFTGDRAQETVKYTKEISLLLKNVGFSIENGINGVEDNKDDTLHSSEIEAEPESGHIAMLFASKNPPAYAEPLRQAFHKIGIETDFIDSQYMKYFKAEALIYIGEKQ